MSSDGEEESRGEGDRGQLRRDVMLGRLVQLTSVDAGGPLPSASLPLLAEQLQSAGLLPRWVAACLAHKPSLFDKAFTLLFKEVQCACVLPPETPCMRKEQGWCTLRHTGGGACAAGGASWQHPSEPPGPPVGRGGGVGRSPLEGAHGACALRAAHAAKYGQQPC